MPIATDLGSPDFQQQGGHPTLEIPQNCIDQSFGAPTSERGSRFHSLMHHSVCGLRPRGELGARREEQSAQPRIGERFVEQTLKRYVKHSVASKGVVAEILRGSEKRPLGRGAPKFGQRSVQTFTFDDAPKYFARRNEGFCQGWAQSNS
jgi:hypothetical protein